MTIDFPLVVFTTAVALIPVWLLLACWQVSRKGPGELSPLQRAEARAMVMTVIALLLGGRR